MRKHLVAVAVAAALMGGAASTAHAADVTVNPFVCSAAGGAATVPAGSTIVVRQGFAEQTLGILTAWLRAETTTLLLNGGAPIDLSAGWSDPVQVQGGGWVSFVSYPTGITLGAGQSLTIALTLSASHVVPEVFNPAAGGPAGQPSNIGGSLSSTFTCTVTGV
jgi:hypothetical protein